MDWITVSKKQRKLKNATTIKICNNNQNLQFKLLHIRDHTLTKDEELKIYGCGICCYCCDSNSISKILNRKFHRCYRCYCCVGDNATSHDCDIFIATNDNITHVLYVTRDDQTNDEEKEYCKYNDYNFIKNKNY